MIISTLYLYSMRSMKQKMIQSIHIVTRSRRRSLRRLLRRPED